MIIKPTINNKNKLYPPVKELLFSDEEFDLSLSSCPYFSIKFVNFFY